MHPHMTEKSQDKVITLTLGHPVFLNNVYRRMDLSQDQLKSEKRRIMKNVIVISFAFLLLFTAFQSMAALQSSINKVRNKLEG